MAVTRQGFIDPGNSLTVATTRSAPSSRNVSVATVRGGCTAFLTEEAIAYLRAATS